MPERRPPVSPPPPDEMKIRVRHDGTGHAYGEGGPEKMSGSEGPDTMPKRLIFKKKPKES